MPESLTTAAQDAGLRSALAEATSRHDAGRGKCVCELCTILAAHPAPETDAPQAIQWAPSGSFLDGNPGEMTRFLAGAGGKTWGYGGGPGAAMTFGTGPWPESVDVLPGQWVVRHPDGTFTVQDDAPAPVSEVTLKVDDAKMLRETLAVAQTATSGFAYTRIDEHVDRIQGLINQLDGHRPLGPDGKHGDLHTATCGCDDAPVSDTRREDVARVRARAIRTANIWDASGDPVIEAWDGEQFTTADLRALAVLPAPPVVDEARLTRIREQVRDVAAGPRGRKCPSCGSAPGDACYGNGPMPKVHGQRLPKECAPEDVAFLLDLVEQRGATRG